MAQPEYSEKYLHQAQMLSDRVKKRYKHLKRRYAKQNLEIFRLYDWDIPEIRAVVDWYAGHLVVAEYVRKGSDPGWLPIMAESVAQVLGVDMAKVHLKERHAGYQDGNRYERVAHTDERIIMSERDLQFYINLHDYVDTGLFSDHRDTRQMVKEMAKGKDFLNLYCYTGSFSCYAAKGGAKTTLSVDRSDTAIQWAKDNMELNGIPVECSIKALGSMGGGQHQEKLENTGECGNQDSLVHDSGQEAQSNILIRAHTFDFLEKAKKKGQMFDLAVVDPPSFSSSRDSRHHFDIAEDHPALLKSVIELMRKGSDSTIFFSTNHQDFEFHIDKLGMDREGTGGVREVKEITSSTIPEDYKTPKKQIHRCWKIIV